MVILREILCDEETAIFQILKADFPEIELISVTPSPDDPNDLWINIIGNHYNAFLFIR